jgi:hypothetical protein
LVVLFLPLECLLNRRVGKSKKKANRNQIRLVREKKLLNKTLKATWKPLISIKQKVA